MGTVAEKAFGAIWTVEFGEGMGIPSRIFSYWMADVLRSAGIQDKAVEVVFYGRIRARMSPIAAHRMRSNTSTRSPVACQWRMP